MDHRNTVLTKNETLKAMGIEVWSLRSMRAAPVVATLEVDPSLGPLEALKAQLAMPEEDAGNAAPVSRVATPTTPISPVSDVSQSTSQSEIRSESTSDAQSSNPSETVSESPSKTQDAPVFRYALLHYGSVGLCVSLSEKSAVPRRLCDDIARLMGGDVKAARFQELKWPMLSNSGIDQSISVAREVVTEKFRMLPPKVIVIGWDVGQSFQPLENLAHMTHGQFGSQEYFLIESISALVASSLEKRRLMTALLSWR